MHWKMQTRMKAIVKIMPRMRAVVLFAVVVFFQSQCNPGEQQESNMQTVTSSDGTKIAYDKVGNGRAVILVSGALASRSAHDSLAQLLSKTFTVFNFDRRGRGESGDNKPYDVKREIEDIEALIKEAGGSAYLYGISSGACLALEAAAALGDKVKKLAIYEAPYDEGDSVVVKWKEYSSTLKDLIAANRNEEAVGFHMKFVGVPDPVMAGIKASPGWPQMKALAPTLLYDVAVVGEDRSVPEHRIASINASALVMDGGESLKSMPFMRRSADKIAKSIPVSQRRTIEGESHNVSNNVMASILIGFFTDNK
jgi:pimeloyl-ACP methyl ester carboxylesterase